MIAGWVLGVATAVMLLCFLGVVLWAFSSRRRAEFEQLARLPLEDGEVHVAKATENHEVRS